MHEDGTRWGNCYLEAGTRVRLDSLLDGEEPSSEFGIVVHCWQDPETSLFDCYIAFFGDAFPEREPTEKPYVLRYYASTLATIP